MKKLKLGELNIAQDEVLTREQLKKVLGGQAVQTTACKNQCDDSTPCPSGYTCYYVVFPNGQGCNRCVENENLAKLQG